MNNQKQEQQSATLVRMQKHVSTKIDLAKAIIHLVICFSNIKLSDTEITILAYFMVYNVNTSTKQLIVKSGVCKNTANIKTIMVKLKKLELIYKDDLNGKVYVAQVLQLKLNNTVALYLKITNEII